MPYLDVVKSLRDASTLPIAVYQVSGEYAMIKAAAIKVQSIYFYNLSWWFIIIHIISQKLL